VNEIQYEKVWSTEGQLSKGYLLYIWFQSLSRNKIEVPNTILRLLGVMCMH
jgi:hypothetical protein